MQISLVAAGGGWGTGAADGVRCEQSLREGGGVVLRFRMTLYSTGSWVGKFSEKSCFRFFPPPIQSLHDVVDRRPSISAGFL